MSTYFLVSAFRIRQSNPGNPDSLLVPMTVPIVPNIVPIEQQKIDTNRLTIEIESKNNNQQ